MIVLGGLLLVTNFGLVSWNSLLDVWALWPILLVAFGLDLISGGRLRIPILIAVVAVGALAWSGTLKLPAVFGGSTSVVAETHTIDVPIGAADRAEVRLSPGVADLTIDVTGSAATLLEGEIATGRGESLIESFDLNSGNAVVELRSEMERVFTNFGRDHRWDLTVSDRVPVELNVDSGVGRSRLDLRGLELTGLHVNGGVGEVVVTLPETGGYSASFDLGVGATRIRIPEGVAASIRIDNGIGSVNVNGDFVRSGERYQTPGFDQARDRVEMTVDGGIGAITVEQIR
jgi:hypothetical protein